MSPSTYSSSRIFLYSVTILPVRLSRMRSRVLSMSTSWWRIFAVSKCFSWKVLMLLSVAYMSSIFCITVSRETSRWLLARSLVV
ncbi:MAG TPA: hypothetical protein VGS79_22415 [Puia sp.]|nr:hypothetical protein [Puia sp.]